MIHIRLRYPLHLFPHNFKSLLGHPLCKCTIADTSSPNPLPFSFADPIFDDPLVVDFSMTLMSPLPFENKSRIRKRIFLSYWKYCLDICSDSGQIESKPCGAIMIPNVKLRANKGDLLENLEKHRRIEGKLNYLTIT
ncbi:unnamed protein product [Lactuca saligna]|uniref:Uncharacterized protein n=1 Tax=Lactuca saligna TaxID=75948 RepID=A0AA35VI22_LACSI|nr:unnamed protein product [Lactuca saligna]